MLHFFLKTYNRNITFLEIIFLRKSLGTSNWFEMQRY